jgi:dolichol kinase
MHTFLSQGALSIYGYWLVSLVWMFYLSVQIPLKFQPSRFRLYLSRKLYHFAAFSMFAPTLIVNRDVTAAALSFALALFVGVEICRLQSDKKTDKEAEVFTKYLSRHLTIEEGALSTDSHPITSHISLLAGFYLPIYFSRGLSLKSQWIEMSGILSVGIGDAMACLFGIMFGRLRISRRSSKTVEGMMAGWVSTCLVRLMIRPLPWHPWLIIVDGVTAAVEAINLQDGCNDNILMPIVGFTLLRGM